MLECAIFGAAELASPALKPSRCRRLAALPTPQERLGHFAPFRGDALEAVRPAATRAFCAFRHAQVLSARCEFSDRDAMLGSIESGYGSYAAFNIKVRRIAQVLKKAARRRAQGAALRSLEVVLGEAAVAC